METQKQVQQPTPPSAGISCRRYIFLICAIACTVVLFFLGIFNQGWALFVPLLFSALSLVLGLIQFCWATPSASPAPVPARKSPKYIRPGYGSGYAILRRQLQAQYYFSTLGAVLIFTPASWVGYTVTLTGPNRSMETYIAVRTVHGQNIYAAVFENLWSHIYHVTIADPSKMVVYQTTVSVQDREVSELHPARNR